MPSAAQSPPPRRPGSRPHTGRARNEVARREILDAAMELALEDVSGLGVEAIAVRAGVGKQTIYRWWTSKYDVVLEALLERVRLTLSRTSSGPLEKDLARFLTETFAGIGRPGGTGPLLRSLMAHAQLDPGFARIWREDFVAPRRAALLEIIGAAVGRGETAPGLDSGALVDLVLGALWFRLLVEHAPLDEAAARSIAALAARAVAP
jgi:AcrR family transcriptional regulator